MRGFADIDLVSVRMPYELTNYLPYPRQEEVEDDLIVDNRCFIELGLKPTSIVDGLIAEVVDVARQFADYCSRSWITCSSAWTSKQGKLIKHSLALKPSIRSATYI